MNINNSSINNKLKNIDEFNKKPSPTLKYILLTIMHSNQSDQLSIRTLAAITLNEIIRYKIPLEVALNKYEAPIALLNLQDQSLLRELCYGCLRWYLQLEFLVKTLLPKPLRNKESLVFILLMLGIHQLMHTRIPKYAAIAATVEAARECKKNWATGLINAVLRNFLRRKEQLLQQLPMQSVTQNNLSSSSFSPSYCANYAHPSWLINALQQAWPGYWQEILQANNQHPPMHLRVNLQAVSRNDYLRLLSQNNITATLAPRNYAGITLTQPCSINDLPHFQSGWVSVQDLAAQFAAELLELKPDNSTLNKRNLRILDACAAPGGKLMHILEVIATASKTTSDFNLAEVVAVEIDQKRLQKIRENLSRFLNSSNSPNASMTLLPRQSPESLKKSPELLHAQLQQQQPSITLLHADALYPGSWWDGKKFTHILIDAPCSASGVIRRHPDIKLLKLATDITKLAEQQLALLETLWPLLAVGGTLVYATCSVLPTENWQVIERFLENHQQTRDAREKRIVADWGVATKFGRQILPGMDNMDGFYYARLEKIVPA